MFAVVSVVFTIVIAVVLPFFCLFLLSIFKTKKDMSESPGVPKPRSMRERPVTMFVNSSQDQENNLRELSTTPMGTLQRTLSRSFNYLGALFNQQPIVSEDASTKTSPPLSTPSSTFSSLSSPSSSSSSSTTSTVSSGSLPGELGPSSFKSANQIRAEKAEQELIKLKQMLEAEKQKQLEKSTNAQRAHAKQLEVEALRQELEKVREKQALEKELRHLKEKQLQQENLALREQVEKEKERVKAEMRAAELNKIKQTLGDIMLQKVKQQKKEELLAEIKQIKDAKRQEEIELREQRVRDLQIQTKELDLQAKRNQMQHQLDDAARKASSTHEAEIQALQEQLKVVEARANDFKALKAQTTALDVKLDLEAPDWNAATWSDGSWQSFEMIEFRLSTTDESEIAKATVVEQSKTMIELRVKAQPFAKGGFRFAHYAQRRDMQRFVLKKLQYSMVSASSPAGALNEIKLVVRIQLLALHCAQSFQNKLDKLVNGKYINIYAVQAMPSGSKVEYWTIEPLLPAKFEKFNGNDGSCVLDHEEPQALSHFSFGFFQEKMVLVDVQGCKEGTQYTYTDPAFHSKTDSFGDSDCGMSGIVKFFETHVCNSKCKALGLRPHEAQKK